MTRIMNVVEAVLALSEEDRRATASSGSGNPVSPCYGNYYGVDHFDDGNGTIFSPISEKSLALDVQND